MLTLPHHWSTRGYLPHYDDGHRVQFVTFRLADALPQNVVSQLKEMAAEDAEYVCAADKYLDAGAGSCLLREEGNAAHVISTLRHRDRVDYHLIAWVVMPNHVHVLFQPINAVHRIVAAWKSVSARKILPPQDPVAAAGGDRAAKRRLWQPEYFDRFIRNEAGRLATVRYIHENPVTAGLVARKNEWPWSSAAGANL